MSRAATDMLTTLGILGDTTETTVSAESTEGLPGAAEAPVTSKGPASPAESAAPGAGDENVSLAEAMAELTGVPVPHEPGAAETEEPPEETADDRVSALEAQVAQLLAEKEELTAQDEEEQFQQDWVEVIQNGKRFYAALERKIEQRGYANGRTRSEIDAVIKHMVLDGNDLERLGAEPGTPGYLEWQETTLLNFAIANGERGKVRAQPSEMERLTEAYHLTADDQATLRRFANYPPEAREEIAKGLGAKNTPQTEKKAAAEAVAIDNVTRNLVNQSAPGVPGPAPRARRYEYTHNPALKRQETELFARTMGFVR